MKRLKLSYLFLLLFVISNIVFLYQHKKIKNNIELVTIYNENLGNLVNENFTYLNQHVSLNADSLTNRLFLRVSNNMCNTCVYKAEAICEKVFGENGFIILSDNVYADEFNSVTTIVNDIVIPELDDFRKNSDPYFFILDDNDKVLFSVRLKTENLDFNYNILQKIKNIYKQ